MTGSCHLVDTGGKKVLFDCGLFQGGKEEEALNAAAFPFDPTAVDALVVSHAHLDHIGRIPLLVKQGFHGAVYAHRATLELAEIVLRDSAHIQETEAVWLSRKRQRLGLSPAQPLYTQADAQAVLAYFQGADYGQRVELGEDLSFTFHDAGHILGSATVQLAAGGKTVVYSGDLGQTGHPIIRDPERVTGADWLLLESTYGDRLHPVREDVREELAAAVDLVVKRGGKLLIPAFAVERTQEILYELSLLLSTKRIPKIPVYVDSPMAIAATQVFVRHRETYDAEFRSFLDAGNDPFAFPGLTFTATAEESMALNNVKGPAIILSASGMCDAGRIKHHLKHNLWRPETVVLFVGYQARGTLGRSLLEGAKSVKVLGERIAVKARIEQANGFSSHADQRGLLEWAKGFRRSVRRVFLVHGEEKATENLRELLEKEGVAASVARFGAAVDLTV